MPGTNYFTEVPYNDLVKVSLTDENDNAVFCECVGNPNVVATEAGTYVAGCFMLRKDLNPGANMYQNIGDIDTPNWGVLATGGGTVPNFADAEIPTGTVDGTRDSFTLAHAASPQASLQLYLNGQLQLPNSVEFEFVNATEIVFITPPLAGGNLIAWYRY